MKMIKRANIQRKTIHNAMQRTANKSGHGKRNVPRCAFGLFMCISISQDARQSIVTHANDTLVFGLCHGNNK